eukprot:SAG11_NODE_2397_length_3404_cov_1.824508_3_plen_204_part_00
MCRRELSCWPGASSTALIVFATVLATGIGAALYEPVRGWIDAATANGAMFLMCSLGYLKYFPGRGEAISDQIPVDLVSNACIVAAAYAPQDSSRTRVVHIGSSSSPTAVTWTETGKWICWTYAIANWRSNPRSKQVCLKPASRQRERHLHVPTQSCTRQSAVDKHCSSFLLSVVCPMACSCNGPLAAISWVRNSGSGCGSHSQ